MSSMAGATPDSDDINFYGTEEQVVGDGDRTVTIEAADTASYEFSVTGVLTPTGAPSKASSRGTAAASISRETHEFSFSGEFTSFTVDGEATVIVDGEEFDASAFPHNTLEIVPDGSVSFDVSASGAVEISAGSAERTGPRRATGTTSEELVLSYAGELTYFDLDGDARLRRNGTRVSADEVLPSTLPSEVSVSATGRTEYVVETTGRTAVQRSPQDARTRDGTIEGTAVGADTTARFSGRVKSIEHPSGATVTIDEESRRVACHAPEDDSVEFTPRSSEAFIYADEVHESPTITVEAGDTSRAKYFGEMTGVTVGDLEVTIAPDKYEEAGDSYLLQLAAEFERTPTYARLEDAADEHARVRHDADGLLGGSVRKTTGDGVRPRDFVTFRFTDLQRGQDGSLSFGRAVDTGEVYQAKNTYEWRTDHGTVDQIEFERLQFAEGVSATNASFETETYDYDIPTPDEQDTSNEQTVSPAFSLDPGDWLDDLWDGITDVADDIAGVTASALDSAINSVIDGVSSVSAEDIAIETGLIFADTVNAVQNLAQKFIDKGWIKAVWKLRYYGGLSITTLAGTGILTEMESGNWGCSACIGLVRVGIDIGICGYGATAACGLLSFPTAGLGGIACGAFFGAVCGYASLALPDAETICGWGTPVEVDVC